MQIKMDFNGLRLEYALGGNSNYIAWKDRMEVVMEDNGLKEFIHKDIPKPAAIDVTLLYAWQNKVARARRILLEGVEIKFSRVSMERRIHMQCGRP